MKRLINLNHLMLVFALLAFSCGRKKETQIKTVREVRYANRAKIGSNDVAEFMRRFNEDSAKVMDEQPPKTGDRTTKATGNSDKFFDYRDEKRAEFKNSKGKPPAKNKDDRAPIASNDHPENLIDIDIQKKQKELYDVGVISNLFKMDALSWQDGKLNKQPWSDDYWAIYKGVLGHRYAQQSEEGYIDSWGEFFDELFHKNGNHLTGEDPIANYVVKRNVLSPSEKYDLIVGDKNFTLTKAMWAEGEYYWREKGKVEKWMGICHGWAPAAYMLDRPLHQVEVKLPKETCESEDCKVTLYPSDIKALGSLVWAKRRAPTRFVGGRCNDKNPAKDANGRILIQACFDNNPATWHQVVVNQIQNQKSFVMDATYDYEVWNQPVQAYKYFYFNVLDATKTSGKLSGDVAVSYKKFRAKDKFTKYRKYSKCSRRTRLSSNNRKICKLYEEIDTNIFIVGIQMEVKYIVETRPTISRSDSPAHDKVATVIYRYDLEVDIKGNIYGGEWYTNRHPDFLWTPGGRLPTESTDVASWDANAGKPLAQFGKVPDLTVVRKLFKLSGTSQGPTEREIPTLTNR